LMYGQPPQTRGNSVQFGQPIAIQALARLLPVGAMEMSGATRGVHQVNGGLESISNEAMNPMLMAAWVGFLITGLNMVPISQLDGGHVIFGLLGRRSKAVCWIAYLSCIGFVTYTSIVFGQPLFILMLLLIPLMGISHPPSRDDNAELGLPRQIIGALSLVIPILCIPLRPIIIL